MLVREARDRYFTENGFSLAGYTDAWVKLKLGPIPFAFPNTEARRAAVKLHDLHHVATGYATTWTGEAEIAAWELAGGCGRHVAAWLLNAGAMGVGLWIAPRRVFRAWVRGRHSKTLYDRAFGDDLLQLTVEALRARLNLDRPAEANAVDVASFLGALALFVVPPVGLAALLLF